MFANTPLAFLRYTRKQTATYLCFVVMISIIPESLWAWDYTDQIMENGRWYDQIDNMNRRIEELGTGRGKQADPRRSERYVQCDAERRKCTECLIQPGVDGLACASVCEENFARCMRAESQPQVPQSLSYPSPYTWHSNTTQTNEISLIRSAASQGDSEAQVKLGALYRGMKNEFEATKWFSMAAEQGHPKAQLFLGYRYLYGVGAPKNPETSVVWFRQAADKGEPEAYEALRLVNFLKQ
jgi:TPR repeat protein